MESLAESRASFLYRSVGFTAKNPPNIVRFARALLGEGALRFVGAPGERGALVTSISRAGCRIYLQHGVSDEENVFAIARGIARWDADRGGPVQDVQRLALAIALPIEVVLDFRAAGRTAEAVAAEYHLPLSVVIDREESLARMRSTSRIRVANDVSVSKKTASDAG